MWTLFTAGGPVMWPLLLCSLIALTLILERAFFWLRYRLNPDKEAVERFLEAYRLGNKQDLPTDAGAVLRMLMSGVAHEKFSCVKAMESVAMDELRRMRWGMKVLDTIITVAPMLGILGTVTGIISSFDILGQTAGAQDPTAVASGISEALITTAAGLIISISTVFPYNYFNSRIDDALDSFERYGTRLEILQKTKSGEKA